MPAPRSRQPPRGFLFLESSENFGGQESQILLQAAALRERGHPVKLLCRKGSGIEAGAQNAGIPFRTIALRNSVDPASGLAVWGELWRGRYLAAMCHSGHDAGLLSLAARLIPRRPSILRVRTYQPGPPKSAPFAKRSDRTLVPSEFLRQTLLANAAIPPDRVHVLRPIVPVERLREEARSPLPVALQDALRGAGPVIVQAAMLRSEKGHGLTLDMLVRLREKFPGIRCVLAGEGSKRSALEKRVAELGLGKQVIFAGFVSPVAPLLARADLVIMPSSREPLGLAQIEALALGVPVAVSDAGGLPETVRHGESGWVLPSGDVGAWTHGVSEALTDRTEALRRAWTGCGEIGGLYGIESHLEALIRHAREAGPHSASSLTPPRNTL